MCTLCQPVTFCQFKIISQTNTGGSGTKQQDLEDLLTRIQINAGNGIWPKVDREGDPRNLIRLIKHFPSRISVRQKNKSRPQFLVNGKGQGNNTEANFTTGSVLLTPSRRTYFRNTRVKSDPYPSARYRLTNFNRNPFLLNPLLVIRQVWKPRCRQIP